MATCHNCQASLRAGQKFCTQCGTPVPVAAPAPSAVPADPPSEASGSETSLQRSMARLGLPVGLSTIIGFFGALVVGLIVPRVLPYIFPIFYPILDFVFRGYPDPFNRFMMTALTFLSSFAVSFFVSYLPRRLGRP